MAQDPGLSGSNNFAGRLTPEIAKGVVAAAEVLRRAAREACGRKGKESDSSSSLERPPPPLLAYGHFPLSTVERLTARSAIKKKKIDATAANDAADAAADDNLDLLPLRLSDLLASAPVSADAYVAGHLHSLFGGRMHRALEKKREEKEEGSQNEKKNENAVLAEWETASFADSRRVRLLVADGPYLSSSDWHWHSPAGPATYAASTMQSENGEGDENSPSPFVSAAISETSSLQPSAAAAGRWLLHLTSPPDARFSAVSSSSSSSSSPVALGSLRALALPLALAGGRGGHGKDPEPPARVRASWRCAPSGQRGGAEMLPISSSSSSSSTSSSTSSSFFFEAAWPEGGCPSGDHAAEIELEAFEEGSRGRLGLRRGQRLAGSAWWGPRMGANLLPLQRC